VTQNGRFGTTPIRQSIPSSSLNVRRFPVGRSGARIRASRAAGDECDFVKVISRSDSGHSPPTSAAAAVLDMVSNMQSTGVVGRWSKLS
jgi:hypothetical protein